MYHRRRLVSATVLLFLAGRESPLAAQTAAPVITSIVSAVNQSVPPLVQGTIAKLTATSLPNDYATASGSPLPTVVLGTSVQINGIDVPLFLVSSAEIRFLIPLGTPVGTVSVTVVSNGVASTGFPLVITAAAPQAQTYVFDFSATSITREAIVAYSDSTPTAPGTTSFSTGQNLIGARSADGSWTFATPPFDINFISGGGAAISFAYTATAGLSFANSPGLYSGIPAHVTVSCQGVGSACIGPSGQTYGAATGTVSITILGGSGPDLAAASGHAGNFAQNQPGQYSLVVGNLGTSSTAGTIIVTDTLPAGLTAVAIGGVGWSCALASLSCSRSDTLAPGAGYPAISVSVNANANAPASVTNTVSVSGGGESNTSNNTGSDVTVVTANADLSIALWDSGNNYQGQIGASAFASVTNAGGSATLGTVTLTAAPPTALTVTGMAGPGWVCLTVTLNCTRSDALAPGATWPPVVITFNISADAAVNIASTVSVAGGSEGNASNDTATVNAAIASVATTISLSSSPNAADPPLALTLTATILPAGAGGRVTFYDGVTVLGSAPLTGGTAVLKTRLPVFTATHILRAMYGGNATYRTSRSAPVTQLASSSPANGFQATTSLAASGASIVLADLNADGFTDLVLDSSVLTGKGDGDFGSALPLPAGVNVCSVATGDWDSDGKADLAVGDAGSVRILSGNGDGTFRPGSTMVIGDYPCAIAVADFDGDGNADLAVANRGENSVAESAIRILLGAGGGTFRPAMNFPAGFSLNAIATADFNGDGVPDLVVGNQYFAGVRVLIGNGNGTFQPAVTYLTGSNTQAIAAGDLTGDGRADIVTGGSDGGINVLVGAGDGSFAAPAAYSVGTSISSVAIADLNGDAIADVAAATEYGHRIGVLHGNANGTLGLPVNYAAGSSLSSIAVGDFNGDGRADLAAVDPYAGTVSILIGTQIPVPFIQAVVPGTVDALSPATEISIGGSNFSAGSTIYFTPPGGTATAIGSITVDQTGNATVSATIPAELLTVPGAAQIAIQTGAGASSNNATFNINSLTPVVTSLSPNTASQYSQAVQVIIAGSNFVSGAVVNFSPPEGNFTQIAPDLVQPNQITVTLPSLLSAGAGQIGVRNPFNYFSGVLPFTVTPSVIPTISSVTPASAVQGSPSLSITIAGTNFTSSSIVEFAAPGGPGPIPLTLSLVQSAQLQATIPASLMTTAGTAQIAVLSGPAGNASNIVAFQVTVAPVTLAVGDGSGVAGDTVEIPIQITSAGIPAVSAFQLDLSFDTSKLTFKSARIGSSTMTAGKSVSNNAQPNGDIRLLGAGLNQTAIGDGTVAYATFTLGSPFITPSVVTPKGCTSADAQGLIIATGCTAGTIRLPACDINVDGTVNVADVQLIINEALGAIVATHDLNHDGVVNVADVQKVINAALGIGCSAP